MVASGKQAVGPVPTDECARLVAAWLGESGAKRQRALYQRIAYAETQLIRERFTACSASILPVADEEAPRRSIKQ